MFGGIEIFFVRVCWILVMSVMKDYFLVRSVMKDFKLNIKIVYFGENLMVFIKDYFIFNLKFLK